MDIDQKVKKSNKIFYDTVGSSYEKIDGRRSESLINYIDNTIKNDYFQESKIYFLICLYLQLML